MSLIQRPRRLRRTPALRRLVAENRLAPADLILPLFVHEGLTQPSVIPHMPGVLAHTQDSLRAAAVTATKAGVGAVMIFAVPLVRDAVGSGATDPDGILSRAVGWIKSETGDALPVIADLCLDEFTDHGHCGVLDSRGLVDNDATLIRYAAMSQVLADAGADMLGTSGMMDGQVGAVRAALDDTGHTDIGVLGYAAKYASAFYGPFRAAVKSELTGDRRTYQQDPANRIEARREVSLDVLEGADIVMVKPAMAYLDIVSDVRASVDVPVAAYVVSGEYAMIEAAAAAGAIDRERAIIEVLLGVKRAGANLLATYWAAEVAGWLTANSATDHE